MQLQNLYFQSLVEPWADGTNGVKIPDNTIYESSTFRITLRGTLVASASGVAAVTFGGNLGIPRLGSDAASILAAYSNQSMLLPTQTYVNTATPANGANSWTMGWQSDGTAGCVDATPLGTAAVPAATAIKCNNWNGVTTQIPTTYHYIRLVSAGLRVFPTSPLTTTQGRMIGFSGPRLDTCTNTPFSTSDIAQRNKMHEMPCARQQNLTVIYKPQDYASYDYARAGESGSTNESSTNRTWVLRYGDPGVPNDIVDESGDAEWAQHCPGELWVMCTGCASGQTFEWEYTGNYEAIPYANNSVAIATSHSINDPIALAHAQNALGAVDLVRASDSPTGASASATTIHHTHAKQEPMLDQILGGLNKVLDFAPGAIGKVGGIMDALMPRIGKKR